MNSETYLAIILEEGRDVWEISLPEYHPQHLPLCPPFIVYNKCKIARYKSKGVGGWGKEPEALASAAASSPRAVWRMRMRISAADPKGRERNPTHRFHAVDHSSNIMT